MGSGRPGCRQAPARPPAALAWSRSPEAALIQPHKTEARTVLGTKTRTDLAPPGIAVKSADINQGSKFLNVSFLSVPCYWDNHAVSGNPYEPTTTQANEQACRDHCATKSWCFTWGLVRSNSACFLFDVDFITKKYETTCCISGPLQCDP